MVPFPHTNPYIVFNLHRNPGLFSKALSHWLEPAFRQPGTGDFALVFPVRGSVVICPRSNTPGPLKLMSARALAPFDFPVFQSHFSSATWDKRRKYLKPFFFNCLIWNVSSLFQGFVLSTLQSLRLVKSVTNSVYEVFFIIKHRLRRC